MSKAFTHVMAISATIPLLSFVADASAVEFDTGTFQGSFNSTLSIGGGRRMHDPSCSLVGDSAACGGTANPVQFAAGDDGDLNYRKGDWFTSYVKGTHELLAKAPDGWKMFARATWKKDFSADDTARTDLSGDARRQIVNNVELLDLWVSKELTIGGQNARVRFGNQVISWGEALFYVGGISNNVLDFQKLQVPGTQLKEAFLPVPALSLSSALSSTVSGEAYYQMKWRRARVPPVGSYFSAGDIYNKGRAPVSFAGSNFNGFGVDQYALTGARSLTDAEAIGAMNANGDFAVPVLGDKYPKLAGEYGFSLKWAPEGTQVNFGAYFQNYHDQLPVLSIVGGSSLQWSFQENRKMFGLTASFPVGNWAVGTELSYRPKDAVALSGCFAPGAQHDARVEASPVPSGDCPLYKDMRKYQLSLTALLQLQRSDNPIILGALGADTGFLSLETAVTRYPGAGGAIRQTVEGVEVEQYAQAGYFAALTPDGSTAKFGTATSWGFVADFNWTYDGKLISGWQVTPGVTYSQAVKGDTPNFAGQFLEGNKSANFYILFNQNPTTWQAGINYTTYFGGKNDVIQRQYLKDRDFIGGFVSYNF